MKTLFRHKPLMLTAFTVCLAGMSVTSCSNDSDTEGIGGGPAPVDINANYANKLAYGDRANLALTYSGDSLIGKDVTFQTTDAKTAELTLNNILPHENSTSIKNVALTPDGKGGYSFKGNATSPLNTTFDYSGTVTKGKLSLDITNAKIRGKEIGKLTLVPYANWEWDASQPKTDADGNQTTYQIQHTGVVVNTDNDVLARLGWTLQTVISRLFTEYLLKDVTFAADGNITATYANIPKGFDFKSFVASGASYTPNPWQTSPKNLATWYIENDTAMYVTPNVDMIIRQVKKDNATRASQGLPPISSLQDIYKKLNEWTTTGVKLTFKENPWKNKYKLFSERQLPNGKKLKLFHKYEGDYIVYISKEQLEPFIPLLKSMLTDEIIQTIVAQSGGMLPEAVLKNLPDLITNTKYFEVGLLFNK